MTVALDGRRTCGAYWSMLALSEAVDVSPSEAQRRTGELLRDSVAAHGRAITATDALLGMIDGTTTTGRMSIISRSARKEARNATRPNLDFESIR